MINRMEAVRQTEARDAARGQEDMGRDEEERTSSQEGLERPGNRRRGRPRRLVQGVEGHEAV